MVVRARRGGGRGRHHPGSEPSRPRLHRMGRTGPPQSAEAGRGLQFYKQGDPVRPRNYMNASPSAREAEYNTFMTHTLRIHAKIPASRKIEITLPDDVPSGEADVVLSVTPSRNKSTAKDLLNSEIRGMWSAREDIEDSIEFARALRKR